MTKVVIASSDDKSAPTYSVLSDYLFLCEHQKE